MHMFEKKKYLVVLLLLMFVDEYGDLDSEPCLWITLSIMLPVCLC